MCLVAGGFVQASCSLGDCALNESCELPLEQSAKGCCSDPVEQSDPIGCFCCELEASHENDMLAAVASPKIQLGGSDVVVAVLDSERPHASIFAKTVPKPSIAFDIGKPVLKERLARLQSLLI